MKNKPFKKFTVDKSNRASVVVLGVADVFFLTQKRHENEEDVNPHIYGHLIFYNKGKNTHWKKRQHLPQKALLKLVVCMQNTRRSIVITLHNSSTPMDPSKTSQNQVHLT